MTFVETITQAIIYLCFAILLGSFILALVPQVNKPTISIPKGALMTATGGIALLSFIPVFQLILYLSPGIGYLQTMQSVLFTFEVGKAWLFTFIIATILFIFIVWFDYRKNKSYAYIGIAIVFILILGLAWSSHASSLDKVVGFISHTAHFTAVSIWVGILFVVSWFAKDYSNWESFLKWFSPTAMFCLVGTIISGFILMSFVVEFKDYTNSWMLPYGQTLLIKHLLMIPLLVYALINSIILKKKLSNQLFNPLPWARMESIIVLLIFSATAALGQQSPPHETLLTEEEISSLFTMFYQGQFQPGMTVNLMLNATSIALCGLALLFIALMMLSFIKKAPVILSILMSVLLVLCLYLSIMLGIQ
ncbi:copper resistance protein CopD [Bacillus sp. DNRA2]|uniref:copper resistance D family protein n=1 Tax=Bacillus sp. DNRA2 TaxID=2723053 RepID=UPI00145C9A08|nr:CopD family protein [Bacillus sp. DNRA2]NMD71229.1 copper resistance protein CopD [Bacillus sp. DNRA2]